MKLVFAFAILSLSTSSAFAWGAFANAEICRSESTEIKVCHQAAQADGGLTTVLSARLKGAAVGGNQNLDMTNYKIVTDADDGSYAKATVIVMQAKSEVADHPAISLFLGDEGTQKVVIRTGLDRGTIIETLRCTHATGADEVSWCEDN